MADPIVMDQLFHSFLIFFNHLVRTEVLESIEISASKRFAEIIIFPKKKIMDHHGGKYFYVALYGK